MSAPAIYMRTDNSIGIIEFSNPARRNAISAIMWDQLTAAIEHLEHDKNIRVVVFRGAGHEVFCAGADISEFDRERSNAEQSAKYSQRAESAYVAIESCHKPTVALIEGACLGAGLALATSCDLRMGVNQSFYGIPAVKIGLGYAYENVARLANVVGSSRARELLLTGRQLRAEEARMVGLLHYQVDEGEKEEEFRALVAALSQNAPLTMTAAKLTLRAFQQPDSIDLLQLAREAVRRCSTSSDYAEGRAAKKERRIPVFNGN